MAEPTERVEKDFLERSNTSRTLSSTPCSPDDEQEWYEAIQQSNHLELVRTATELRSQRSKNASHAERDIDIFHSDVPELDPTNAAFDGLKWARHVTRAVQDEGIPQYSPGVCFQDLGVSGNGDALHFQSTVGSSLLAPLKLFTRWGKKSREKQILHGFTGLLDAGELLLVLGRPGSGCTTTLKTLTGQLGGLKVKPESKIHYKGISLERMIKEYRGEVAYNGETDRHFAYLTVKETLQFAASARAPHTRVQSTSREDYVDVIVRVAMALYGLIHTKDTIVGSEMVRGVSGGERKRVSIAEMALARVRIAAWDNSTRGLDAATALEFVQTLRNFADVSGSCHVVAAYQASQAMFDVCDKVTVLYEGRQIYYGPCANAVSYFECMGWLRPQRQVAGDFLSSITNPRERVARDGMEAQVPRTAQEFEERWKNSPEFEALLKDIANYEIDYPTDGELRRDIEHAKHAAQAKHVRPKSSYLLSVPMQVRLCIKRAYQRMRNDRAATLSTVMSQTILALIVGSVFYNTPAASAGFFQKGAVLFFSVLMNALITVNEIGLLYAQRPIVEKQTAYSFVHPWTEALAGILTDLPIKMARVTVFCIILYFLVDLRREPSQFFIYYLFINMIVINMSSMFRSVAALTKNVGQAMAIAGVMIICMVVYAGFTLPQPYMHPWFSWIRWINPVYYAYESLIENEFHGRNFTCSTYIPDYAVLSGNSFICSVTGAVAGQRYVSGDRYLAVNYEYSYSHVWRNFGILLGFMIFFLMVYLIASELNNGSGSTAEYLVFRKGHVPAYMQDFNKTNANSDMMEATMQRTKTQGDKVDAIPVQSDVFTWRNVCYDVPVKGGQRRLLDNVSGFVRPGTLTALMGVSGAGKTTLLDVLAQRVSVGVVSGDMFVNGQTLDASFQRKTGYVQQQDLHLETSTVREALRFSAVLRQPKSVSKEDKYGYVEEVIKILAMEDFAEAVVGTVGEGLNVEQRKLLTIGVELAAKPALLIFLDEPTSGLDSQSSWAICQFMKKLAHHGQAVLSTIHQPSAILFQEFDRLLFLAKGGKTVYFGDIGEQSKTLTSYFESHGARLCAAEENPAEWMLEIIGAGASGKSEQDWPALWLESPQAQQIQADIDRIHEETANQAPAKVSKEEAAEFAMPFTSQLWYVTRRVFQQYWRQPEYIFSKLILGIVSSLFIGFSFWMPDSTQQGFQDVLLSLFLLCTIFTTLVNQIMPKFIVQRALYEVRERPSKIYGWQAFILAQITVEIPWQWLLAVCAWASYYWSVFGSDQSAERIGLIVLFLISFYTFASTFAQFIVSAMPDAATGAMIGTLMYGLTLIFNGIMQPPDALPGFWIFMYRVSPLTYYIGGVAATALHGRQIVCNTQELSVFDPPSGETCGQYLASYLDTAQGRLYNPNATSSCEYCSLSNADQYLAGRDIHWSQRWRNYGILWAYIAFNVFGCVALYYIFRVKKWSLKTLLHRTK